MNGIDIQDKICKTTEMEKKEGKLHRLNALIQKVVAFYMDKTRRGERV